MGEGMSRQRVHKDGWGDEKLSTNSIDWIQGGAGERETKSSSSHEVDAVIQWGKKKSRVESSNQLLLTRQHKR